MGDQLAKLKADMTHAAFECASSISPVFVRKELKVSNRRHMEDRGDGLFLLPLVCYARLHGLERRDVRLPQFEVIGWLPIHDADRQPWKITGFSVRH